MAQSDDDYRTLKPTEAADDRYGTLAPPRKTPPPPPKRPAPRPAPAVEPTLQPQSEPAPAAPPGVKATPPAARPPAEALRLTAKLARPFCRLFPLSEEAGRLLDEKQTLLVYLYRLMNERLFVDAVRLLAHALPPRDGIRWAADCVKSSASSAPAAPLASVEAWLTDPSEPNRRAGGEAAAAAGCATAAGSAALAVFLSGGSITPADRPAVAPGEHLAARAVANAVILAALGGERGKAAERYFQYLKEGIAVAAGRS